MSTLLLALAGAALITCAAARLGPATRTRRPASEPEATLAWAASLLRRAELHHRAFLDGESPFDADLAAGMSDDAVTLLDELCDRMPDRERPAAWQRLRAEARRLQGEIRAARRRLLRSIA